MSIAAKCICGESLYYCVGADRCPYKMRNYNFGEPPESKWIPPSAHVHSLIHELAMKTFETIQEVKRKKLDHKQEIISKLKSTTVILPR